MNLKLACLFTALGISTPATFAASPASLEQTNPLGHQMLSAENYLHFIPASEPLTGTLAFAFSGTSELFVQGMMNRLTQIHPGIT